MNTALPPKPRAKTAKSDEQVLEGQSSWEKRDQSPKQWEIEGKLINLFTFIF